MSAILGLLMGSISLGLDGIGGDPGTDPRSGYIWVWLSFLVPCLCGFAVVMVKYSSCCVRRRPLSEQRKETNDNYANYNTFNNLKKHLGPDRLTTAMEAATRSSGVLRISQSCPNFQKALPQQQRFRYQRRYSGSYLNMLKLEPITEDHHEYQDEERFEAS
uniref:Uncharacterized protein n=1 Tax=Lotharella oceanica TaxID=641309 RepID=A0A7S2TI35_9EUKA|mmetsp:Transcript_12606/g.24106  ORF Transcript_12606/g.24106 Transcript_12606/m.24106 type:complete len:161 (+) Transcript_12606:80-562(+)